MRELQTSDLFAFVRLIEKSGIKDELKAKALEIKSIADINAESLGYDIILMMLEKAAEPKTEKEVYAFFAPIFEMKEEEIKKMDAIEFLEGYLGQRSLHLNGGEIFSHWQSNHRNRNQRAFASAVSFT